MVLWVQKKGLIDHCKVKPELEDYCRRLYSKLSKHGLSVGSLPSVTHTNICTDYNDTTVIIGPAQPRVYTCNPFHIRGIEMLSLIPVGGNTSVANLFFVINRFNVEINSPTYYSQAYEAIKASERIAYLDTRERVETFEAYASVLEEKEGTGRRFLPGSGNIFSSTVGYKMSFSYDDLSKSEHKVHIYERLQHLMQSGIHGLWEKWDRILFPRVSDGILKKQAESNALPKVLSLETNILSIFIISTIFLVICLTCFIVEYVPFRKIWNRVCVVASYSYNGLTFYAQFHIRLWKLQTQNSRKSRVIAWVWEWDACRTVISNYIVFSG